MTKDRHKGSGTKKPRPENHRFRVLGIAMIVDQRGIGARMVARYPTQPSPVLKESECDEHNFDEEENADDDLFFSLTAFQMAKLFRTKRTLCGEPMTLTVNETVFCCRAVLLDTDEAMDEIPTSESKNQLVLFSVIIALSSPTTHTSVPFSWIHGGTGEALDLRRCIEEATAAASASESRSRKKADNGRISSALLSIRRVHISIARYCRVLEREEKRCQYISEQADLFFKIRNERQKKWEQQKIASASVATQQGANNPSSGSSSVISSSTAQTGAERRRHSRQKSLGDEISFHVKLKPSIREEQEKEQDILELMLAAFPQEPKASINRGRKHRGNLVRELVQVFHSLSRNDYGFPQTPTALLSERDGVVHVNSHIAIPIEAASVRPSLASTDGPLLRPYYTLLFPHASPSELLEAFQTSGSAAPQRLQQLLLTVNPQKPLSEIAVDANLPLYTTMEIASYLVTHGACVTSPIVSRNSRLSCLPVEKIPQLALEFSQTFANVNFFRLVGFLTSSQTLGESMSILNDVENEDAAFLRECLAPRGDVQPDLSGAMVYSSEEPSIAPTGQSQQQQSQEQRRQRSVEELDESLFAMTIWLFSHRVLTQMQEYLVAIDSVPHGEPAVPQKVSTYDADEKFFRELMESEFLNGNVSIMAVSWRLGFDQQKVRSWALRHNRVRVVSRLPATGDDWEFNSHEGTTW